MVARIQVGLVLLALLKLATCQWALLDEQLPVAIGDVRGCMIDTVVEGVQKSMMFVWGKTDNGTSGTLAYDFLADPPQWFYDIGGDTMFLQTAVSDIVAYKQWCFLFGGEGQKDLQVWDAATWTWRPDVIPGPGKLGHFAGQAGLLTSEGRTHAVWTGGIGKDAMEGNTAQSDTYFLDITDYPMVGEWVKGEDIPEAGGLSKAVVGYSLLDQELWLISGRDGKYKNSEGVSTAYMLTQPDATGTWLSISFEDDPLFQSRGAAGGFQLGSYIFMIGGEHPGATPPPLGLTEDGVFDRMDVYDTETGQWMSSTNDDSELFPLIAPVQTPFCTYYGGYIYCVGGGLKSGTATSTSFQMVAVPQFIMMTLELDSPMGTLAPAPM